MSGLNLLELGETIATSGPAMRIVIVKHQGSSPRETGASMIVTKHTQSGTIGGGALEFKAIETARKMLANSTPNKFEKTPLGPALGQCCGGTVSLLWERFEDAKVAGDTYARSITDTEMPLSVRSHLRNIRSGATPNQPALIDGWFIEPVSQPKQPIWIYGAGHVGRALVSVLDDLPFEITWIDSDLERFPSNVKANILVAKIPADAVKHAPDDAFHIVLTYSHAIDLEICHHVLTRPFAHLGLIGSATKRARFIKRLSEAGADPSRLECPIGDPSLGKEPMAIAIGVVSGLLKIQTSIDSKRAKA